MGHDGRRLTLADLPSPKTKRWVIRRKAEVVAAVRGGLLSLEDACSLYTLNTDEFQSWEFCIDHYGIKGLRTTRTQFYFTGMPRHTNSAGMVPARTPVICAPPLEKLLRMQGRAKWRSESWIVARQFHSSGKLFRRSCAICLSRWLVICLLSAGLLLTTG
jgi:hypothetical protein